VWKIPRWQDCLLVDHITRKGAHREYDSYSGFKDDGDMNTDLHAYLQQHQIERLFIFGLALDYCVKATAIDAYHLSYDTTVMTALSRGFQPETTTQAIETMKKLGINIVTDNHLVNLSKLKPIKTHIKLTGSLCLIIPISIPDLPPLCSLSRNNTQKKYRQVHYYLS